MTIKKTIEVFEQWWSLFYHNDDGTDQDSHEMRQAVETALPILKAQQEAEKNEPLTSAELREMAGKPAWCPECDAWGIVKYETVGRFANVPFLVGAWHDEFGGAVNFTYNIEARGLTLYRHKPKEG